MSQNSAIKRICVYGIGGVGGYFGGRIANATNKNREARYESYFIARGHHLEAIQQNGIKVVSPGQTIVGIPTKATNDISEIPRPDLILLCVKGYDLGGAVKSIRSRVRAKTVVVPLLNGADIYDRVRDNLDDGIVLPACVFVSAHIQQPGVVYHGGGEGKIAFGKDPGFPEFDAEDVIRVFSEVGINYQWNDDAFPAIWGKYIFIAAFGLVTVYTGKSIGEVLEDNAAKLIVREIMEEIYEIARRKNIEISPGIVDESIDKAHGFPFDTRTSYQRDVETKGMLNEGDLYGGTIIREGKALGISTPTTSAIYSEIQNRLMGQEGP